MSKLNSDKINYNESDFLIEVESDGFNSLISKRDLLLNRAQNEIGSAKQQAEEMIQEAKMEAQLQADKIIEDANQQAQNIIEEAKKQAENIVEEGNTSKNEILTTAQQEVERASQEGANKGYEEGYQDAQNKFFEENEEKIKAFSDFCEIQSVVRDKILKNASREILNIVQNISKAVIMKELDSESLEKIIKKTITAFDKKENITIILSEKYAKLLYEIQKRELDIELNFEDFRQYQGFNVVYNKEFPDDTIIVENPQERFCASITGQLDKIIREILENTQNGVLDTEEYEETSTTE